RGDILRGDLGAIARARGAVLWSRSARPIMTDPASLGLSLGLHRGGLGQAHVEDHGASPISGPERVDRGKCGFGVERLHGARGLLLRLEDDGAAADDAWQAPFRDGGHCRHPDQGDRQQASLEHPLPSPCPRSPQRIIFSLKMGSKSAAQMRGRRVAWRPTLASPEPERERMRDAAKSLTRKRTSLPTHYMAPTRSIA